MKAMVMISFVLISLGGIVSGEMYVIRTADKKRYLIKTKTPLKLENYMKNKDYSLDLNDKKSALILKRNNLNDKKPLYTNEPGLTNESSGVTDKIITDQPLEPEIEADERLIDVQDDYRPTANNLKQTKEIDQLSDNLEYTPKANGKPTNTDNDTATNVADSTDEPTQFESAIDDKLLEELPLHENKESKDHIGVVDKLAKEKPKIEMTMEEFNGKMVANDETQKTKSKDDKDTMNIDNSSIELTQQDYMIGKRDKPKIEMTMEEFIGKKDDRGKTEKSKSKDDSS